MAIDKNAAQKLIGLIDQGRARVLDSINLNAGEGGVRWIEKPIQLPLAEAAGAAFQRRVIDARGRDEKIVLLREHFGPTLYVPPANGGEVSEGSVILDLKVLNQLAKGVAREGGRED